MHYVIVYKKEIEGKWVEIIDRRSKQKRKYTYDGSVTVEDYLRSYWKVSDGERDNARVCITRNLMWQLNPQSLLRY